ncbi:MAG: hypothetical protein RL264_708 [Bacteroidota bacterium]
MLIITYYWPPSGGSGVQRWLKFVKYLRDFGVEPIILTVHPEHAVYPILDETLKKEIPEGVRVIYTEAKSPLDFYKKVRKKNVPHTGFAGQEKAGIVEKIMRFIRGNFFIPDARIGWNKYALVAAEKIIQEEQIDSIVTTSPPHSTQLIGLALKRKFKLNWLADLRDPWTEIYYNNLLFRTQFAKRKDKRFETSCLENADAVVVVSEDIKRMFGNGRKELLDKIHVVPNGFDTSDFGDEKRSPDSYREENGKWTTETPESVTPVIPNDLKILRYVGNLGEQYPIEDALVALKKLNDSGALWQLEIVGNCPAKVTQRATELGLTEKIKFISYVPHGDAIRYMQTADALLLVIPQIENNKGILTGKLFEYLATGNPIVCVGPEEGDAAQILSEFHNCRCFSYSQASAIATWLPKILQAPKGDFKDRMRYSRKQLTGVIADLVK